MKNTLKTAVISTSFLFAPFAFAHDVSGSLGKDAGATDLYMVTCSDGSGRLGIQVADLAPKAAPKVTVQAIKGMKAVTSTDNIDGDGKNSPMVYNYGGDGSYIVTVSKTAAGMENYALEFHCQDEAGLVHTSTDITPALQNQ